MAQCLSKVTVTVETEVVPRDTELLSRYSLDDCSLPERTRDLV